MDHISILTDCLKSSRKITKNCHTVSIYWVSTIQIFIILLNPPRFTEGNHHAEEFIIGSWWQLFSRTLCQNNSVSVMLRTGQEDQVSSYCKNPSETWWKPRPSSSSRDGEDRADLGKKTLDDVGQKQWRMTPNAWQHCNIWNITIQETFLHFGSTVLDHHINSFIRAHNRAYFTEIRNYIY